MNTDDKDNFVNPTYWIGIRSFFFDKTQYKILYFHFFIITGYEQALYEIFFVRSWIGYDCRRIALFYVSGKNEILDRKNCCHTRKLSAQVRICAHGTRDVPDLFWKNLSRNQKNDEGRLTNDKRLMVSGVSVQVSGFSNSLSWHPKPDTWNLSCFLLAQLSRQPDPLLKSTIFEKA